MVWRSQCARHVLDWLSAVQRSCQPFRWQVHRSFHSTTAVHFHYAVNTKHQPWSHQQHSSFTVLLMHCTALGKNWKHLIWVYLCTVAFQLCVALLSAIVPFQLLHREPGAVLHPVSLTSLLWLTTFKRELKTQSYLRVLLVFDLLFNILAPITTLRVFFLWLYST